MRRFLKKLLRLGLWLLAILWVGYSIAWWKFNDETLGAFVSGRVNKVERGNFQLRVIHFPYWSGFLSLLINTPARAYGADYELKDPDGHTVIKTAYAETDVHIQELIVSLVKYAVTQRFHLNLHFARAYVPEAMAVIAPTRATWGRGKAEINIVAAMSPKVKVPPAGGEFRITVDDVIIEKTHFGIGYPNDQGKASWWGRFENGKAHAQLVYSSRPSLETPEGPYFFFKVKPLDAATAELKIGPQTLPLESLHVEDFGPGAERRGNILFKATTKSMGADIKIDGALTDSYSLKPGVWLTLAFEHGKKLLAALPAPAPEYLGGDPSGTFSARGPFSAVTLEADVKGLEATVEGVTAKAMSARLRLAQGVLKADPVSATIAGGKAQVTGELRLVAPRKLKGELTLKGVDAAGLPQVPKALHDLVSGKLGGTAKFSGTLGGGNSVVSVSAIALELDRARPGRLPRVVRLAGGMDVEPHDIRLNALEAVGDGLRVKVNGLIDPKGGRLNGRFEVSSERGASWYGHAGAPSSLKLLEGHASGQLMGTLARPIIAGTVELSQVAFHGRSLARLEAGVTLRGGALVLSDIQGAGLGGTVTGEAEMRFLGESGDVLRPLATPTLRADLRAEGVSVAAATDWNNIDGRADISLVIDGPVTDPVGDATVNLPTLSLEGDPYHKGRLRVRFGGGGATIRELSLGRKGGGAFSGSGRVGWDGTLDLSLHPQSFPIAAIPGIRGLPVSLAGLLSGDLEMKGKSDDPEIGGIIQLVGAKVRETLLGDGNVKLIPGADAIAIKGSLFGTVSVDGYLTLFPKFTVAVTLRFDDIELERILPEMKKLAEISGRASGEARVTFDGSSGLTFAGIKLTRLALNLTGEEDAGHARNLVVRNQDDVLMSTDGNVLRVERAHLTSGVGDFYIVGQVSQAASDVHLHGGTRLELLEYFFRGAFEHTHGEAELDLRIRGNLAKPQLLGWLNLKRAGLQPRGLEQSIGVPAGRLLFSEDKITLQSLTVELDRQKVSMEGAVALQKGELAGLTGRVWGDVSPRLFQWLFKDYISDATGDIALDIQMAGTWKQPLWNGWARIKSATGRFRSWDQAIDIKSGTFNFATNRITLQSIKALIDDHPLLIKGWLNLGAGFTLGKLEVELHGDELGQATPTYRLAFSPHVVIRGDGEGHLRADGTIEINEGVYSQEFELIDLVLRPRTVEKNVPFWVGVPALETMKLNITRVDSTGPIKIKNGIAELDMNARLRVGGTLSDPRIGGTLTVEEGGWVRIPGFRIDFRSKGGTVNFEEEKTIPNETPVLAIAGEGDLIDPRSEATRKIYVQVNGTIPPRVTFSSSDGLDQATILALLVTGRTVDQFRAGANPTPGQQQSGVTGSNASDNVAKSVTGSLVGQALVDPFRKVFQLDIASIEFGTGSFDVKLCKRLARVFNACGFSQVGFAGQSRVEGSLALRISDYINLAGGVGYLSRGVDTLQDSITRLRLELKLQFPLGW